MAPVYVYLYKSADDDNISRDWIRVEWTLLQKVAHKNITIIFDATLLIYPEQKTTQWLSDWLNRNAICRFAFVIPTNERLSQIKHATYMFSVNLNLDACFNFVSKFTTILPNFQSTYSRLLHIPCIGVYWNDRYKWLVSAVSGFHYHFRQKMKYN